MQLERTVTRIRVGVLATFLWCCTALLAQAADTALVGPDSALADSREEIRLLREQISLSNLLNGLYLSNEQMRQVLAYAKEAEALRQEYRTQNAALVSQMAGAFGALKQEVVVGNGISDEVGKRAAGLNHRAKELREELERELSRIEDKLTLTLTDGQKQTIKEFKPCLLPPRKLGQPERAGQAHDAAPAVNMLERIRQMPERRYQFRRDTMITRVVDRQADVARLVMSDRERSQEHQRLGTLLDKVRSMPDVEFSLQKGALAEEIIRPILEAEAKHQQAIEQLRRPNQPGKIGRFLLNPTIIPIIEHKLEIADGYEITELANIKSVVPAENCDDGNCALQD